MHMLAGGHKAGARVHFKRRDWQICDTDVDPTGRVAVPMGAGDVLLFDGKLPHGTPINRTDEFRWAVQYHYRPGQRRARSTTPRGWRVRQRGPRRDVLSASGAEFFPPAKIFSRVTLKDGSLAIPTCVSDAQPARSPIARSTPRESDMPNRYSQYT